jgi:hypothetical protein
MRREIVGIANPADAAPAQLSSFGDHDVPCPREPEPKIRSRRMPWPSLLRRVFAVDIARMSLPLRHFYPRRARPARSGRRETGVPAG